MILVVGSSGFVGQHLCSALRDGNIRYLDVSRNYGASYVLQDLASVDNWKTVLKDVSFVFYFLSRAHRKDNNSLDAKNDFEYVNNTILGAFLGACNESSVKKIVYLSSIKVYGDYRSTPFRVEDVCRPLDYYGQSKYKSELQLKSFHTVKKIDVLILRIPLVLGYGAKANLASVLNFYKMLTFIPSVCSKNKRSVISIAYLITYLLDEIRSDFESSFVIKNLYSDVLSTDEIFFRQLQFYFSEPRIIRFPLLNFLFSFNLNIFKSLNSDLLME